jgi:hypothetical protein
MKLPLRITFRMSPSSNEIEAEIHESDADVIRGHDEDVGCRLVMDLPHRCGDTRDRSHLRIEMSVRGDEIVLSPARVSRHRL